MLKEWKIYLKLTKIQILAGLEYKGWRLMFLYVMFYLVTDPLAIVLIFSRFGSIGEWSMERIMLVYMMTVTFFNITVLILALLGGFLMYTGFFVMTSGVAFFTVKGLDWIYIFTSGARQVTRCPIDYLPEILWGTFTFLIPILVISYYPASLICGWSEPAFMGFLAFPAGFLFLMLSLMVWKIGVRHYKSTGS